MQTIVTKYLPVTNTRGSRIKATCWLGSVTIPYPYELRCMERHKLAAQKLVDKMNEDKDGSPWVIVASGELPDSSGYAFIIDWSTNDDQ